MRTTTIKYAAFVQIAHNAASVQGTYDSVEYDPVGGLGRGWNPPIVVHGTVTGNDDGSRLSLTFTPDRNSGGAPFSRSGSWQGANMVLDTPQKDGSLAKSVFVPASPKDYNAAVKALETDV